MLVDYVRMFSSWYKEHYVSGLCSECFLRDIKSIMLVDYVRMFSSWYKEHYVSGLC